MLKAAFRGTLSAVAGLVLAACSPFGGASIFTCEQDSQCSPNGTCRMPEALCVFPNDACASGEAYGQHSGSMSGQCVGGDLPPVDAPIDAPTECTPNAKSCFNHAVETCRADGAGFDPALRQPCALTCTTTGTIECTGAATNIPLADQEMCNADGMALSLSPPAGATVTIGATEITCAPACNAANQTTIPRTAAAPNNFYCLASIMIPVGVTVTAGAGIADGVTLFSHGAVVINSDITFNGGNAAGVLDANDANDTPGAGGPGGFGGAPAVANGNGANGGGPAVCGGRGGASGGNGAGAIGGGGGGGGNVANGGTGGTGAINGSNGGAGGTSATCSTPELKPLVGGAGGGGGADGGCGQDVQCGWPGGGGGGALHIVSRSMISGTGTLAANGGNGFGSDNDNGFTAQGGAGGGGAGGGILLEAPMVMWGGALQVNGGNGGRSRSQAAGGTGATTGSTTGGNGPNANAVGGGTGGGGGGGRIRINAANAACTGASPTASCTTGAIRNAP